ncbi:MAG: hypothetical protein SW833_10240 [Cyanobacteriota bacterium]|nr:hypothetical protein [Cyanobacteriota bacterium]
MMFFDAALPTPAESAKLKGLGGLRSRSAFRTTSRSAFRTTPCVSTSDTQGRAKKFLLALVATQLSLLIGFSSTYEFFSLVSPRSLSANAAVQQASDYHPPDLGAPTDSVGAATR